MYGALSFLTMAFYILTVGGFAYYFRSNETNLLISFIATGVVAILFEPLRQRLQRAVNRLMYGERDDPATVLTRLSQRLEFCPGPRFGFADHCGNPGADPAAALCRDRSFR